MVCGKIFKNDPTLKHHLRSMHNIFKADYEKVYDQAVFVSDSIEPGQYSESQATVTCNNQF